AAGRRARTRQQPPLPRRGPAPRRAHARPSRPRRGERVTPTRTPARRPLHEGWHLTITDGPAPVAVRDVPATVPGTLITDLHAAGLIEDPYLDRNEHDLAWTGECDVTYATRFDWRATGADRVDLVADSLDTAATVEIGRASCRERAEASGGAVGWTHREGTQSRPG